MGKRLLRYAGVLIAGISMLFFWTDFVRAQTEATPEVIVTDDGQVYQVITMEEDSATDVMSQYFAAKLLRSEGRRQNALDALRQAQRIAPDSLFLRVQEAEILYEMSELDEAIAVIQEARQMAPEQADAAALEGTLWLEKGEALDALQCFEEALAIDPDHLLALRQAASLYSHRSIQEWGKAIPLFLRLQRVDSGQRPTYAYRLGECYYNLKRYEEALQQFKTVVAERRYMFAYFFMVEILVEKLNRPDEGLALIREALELDPFNVLLLKYAAKLCARFELPAEELDYWKRLLTTGLDEEENPEVLRRAGDLAFALRRFDEAVDFYTRRVQIEPRDPQAQHLLGLALAQGGNPEEGLEVLENLSGMDPLDQSDLSVQLDLAGVYARVNDSTRALEVLEKALLEHPRNPDVYLQWGKIALAFNDYPTATEKLEKSLSLGVDPQVPVLVMLGQSALQQNDFGEAEKWFERAVTQTVTDRKGIVLRDAGMLCWDAEAWSLAARFFEQALELAPGDVALMLRLGDLNGLQGQWPAAGEWYQKANTLRPDDVLIWQRIGFQHTQMKNWKEAEEAYQQALKILPDWWSLWLDLGVLYMLQDRDQEAEEAYREALVQDPNNRQVLLQLGFLYDKMDRVDKAEEFARRIIDQNKEDAEAYNFLGYMFAERNMKLQEAEKLVQRALELDPGNANILDSVGWVYYKMGDLQRAIQYLRQAAEKTPKTAENAVIYEHLGDAYWKSGKQDEAIKWWNKAFTLDPDTEGLAEKIESGLPEHEESKPEHSRQSY